MFNEIYTFFYELLFAGQTAVIGAQMQEYACVTLTIILFAVIAYVAFMPIKALLNLVFRGI